MLPGHTPVYFSIIMYLSRLYVGTSDVHIVRASYRDERFLFLKCFRTLPRFYVLADVILAIFVNWAQRTNTVYLSCTYILKIYEMFNDSDNIPIWQLHVLAPK